MVNAATAAGTLEGEALMALEPGPHLGVLVSGVIVEDDVDELSGRHLRLDRIQEADELLMPVALHATADDLAFENIESGEEGGRAVAFVVVGHRAGAARSSLVFNILLARYAQAARS
jgi:hypothetical protein